MMQAGDLVLEASAVTLFEDRRSDENEEIAFGAGVQVFLEEVAEHGDVTHDRDLGLALGNFVLKQATDGERVAALDEDV